jgi:hypothetical protein
MAIAEPDLELLQTMVQRVLNDGVPGVAGNAPRQPFADAKPEAEAAAYLARVPWSSPPCPSNRRLVHVLACLGSGAGGAKDQRRMPASKGWSRTNHPLFAKRMVVDTVGREEEMGMVGWFLGTTKFGRQQADD